MKDGPAVHHGIRIAGIRFRPFRGMGGFPPIVAIMDACNRVDRAEYNESVEDVAHVFAHLTNSGPSTDMLFAQVGDRTIAWARVFWKDEFR